MIQIFWDVMQCRLVYSDGRFGAAWCLHL